MVAVLTIYKMREARYELAIAVVATALLLIFFLPTVEYTIQTYLLTYVSVTTTLLGFLLAAYALLLAFPKTGRLNITQHHKNFSKIYKYFLMSLYLTLLFLILSLLGLYIISVGFPLCYIIIFTFLQIYVPIMLFRVIWLLSSLTEELFKK